MIISLWRLALLTLFLASAAGAGRTLLRVARLDRTPALNSAVCLLMGLTLGLGVLSYMTLAIGLLGWLYAPVVWGLLLVLAVAGVWSGDGVLAQGIAVGLRRMRAVASELSWPYKVLLAWLALTAGLNLIGALAPPLGPDDLHYHFAVTRRYVAAHSIHFIPDKYYSNLPYVMEMLWTAAIAIDTGELAQLINWFNGLLAVGWIALLARQARLNWRHVILAGVLFYSISTVSDQSRSGSVELGGTVFVLACILGLLQWQAQRRLQWLALAGVLAGLYAGTKLPNLIAVALLAGWVLAADWRHSHRLRTAFTSAFLFGMIATGVVSVWYLKTWAMTGNPVYPFLQSVLGGPPMRAELLHDGFTDVSNMWLTSLRRENPLWRLLLQPYRLIMDPQLLRGHVSPLFVALLPLVVVSAVRAQSRSRTALGFALLLYLYWVPIYLLVRTGLPVLALMSIAIAEAVLEFAKRGRFARWTIATTLVLWLATSLIGVLRDTVPAMPVVAGQQSVDEYLLTRGPDQFNFTAYDAYLFINQELPADARVLLWESRGYYLERSYVHASEFVQTLANPARIYDPQYVVDELRRFGITHVAMNDNYLRRRLRQTLEATGRLECLYEGRTMVVCALTTAVDAEGRTEVAVQP